ncbi:transcription factor HES-4-like [Homarus americanus]|uniref:transcription factor HES-4-like n=1 Tax=Homarus americanus TaxID=6706 RepID=UPI001C4646D3|nr:transcription factor HES-4-like [Homarus americanus]
MCTSSNSSMADTHKTRRSNKPLMERRRRERINHCLNELKNLVLTAQRKDPTRYSKLEKADILEMTVRHVQALHRQDTSTSRHQSTDSTAKYRAGFTQCAAEVSRFLAGLNGLPPDLHARVLSHLSSTTTPEPANIKSEAEMDEVPVSKGSPQQQEAPQGSLTGVPLVQARLPSGQLALVLPSWTAISSGNSSPTNAASPEAAGAPSSPESARGSPQAAPDAPEDLASPETCTSSDHLVSSHLESSFGHSSSPEATVGHQPAPQVVPLDLATPHRRTAPQTVSRQRSFTVSVSLTRSPPTLKPKAAVLPRPVVTPAVQRPTQCVLPAPAAPSQCHGLREGRHAPYPVHRHHHHQHPHWRPW